MTRIRHKQNVGEAQRAQSANASANRMVDNVNRMVEAQNVNPKRWCLVTASERRIIMRALSLLKHSSGAVTDLCINKQPEVDALNKSIQEVMKKFAESYWMEDFVDSLPAEIKVPGKHSAKE